MNRYSPRRTMQSPLLRHFSVSLRNNSQPSNEVLLQEYLFITVIVTEYSIYMTILLPRAAFVTDSSVCVTISRLAATNLTAWNKKKTSRFSSEGLWRLAATYSPTWYSSTIGANGLNFSVRDGKRWIPVAITTIILSLNACALGFFGCVLSQYMV